MELEAFYDKAKDADYIIYIWSMGGKPETLEAFAERAVAGDAACEHDGADVEILRGVERLPAQHVYDGLLIGREDVEKDLEGLQTVRNIAHNMAFLIRSIAAQKEEKGLPVEEHGSFTSFPDGK